MHNIINNRKHTLFVYGYDIATKKFPAYLLFNAQLVKYNAQKKSLDVLNVLNQYFNICEILKLQIHLILAL